MKKLIFLLWFVAFILTVSINIMAHEIVLNVKYDDCIPANYIDGEDEMWYMLYINTSDNKLNYFHVGDDIVTIKYWFENNAINDENYTWTSESGLTEEVALEIKNAYINSMKKWNDVYFYSYDENGTKKTNKYY